MRSKRPRCSVNSNLSEFLGCKSPLEPCFTVWNYQSHWLISQENSELPGNFRIWTGLKSQVACRADTYLSKEGSKLSGLTQWRFTSWYWTVLVTNSWPITKYTRISTKPSYTSWPNWPFLQHQWLWENLWFSVLIFLSRAQNRNCLLWGNFAWKWPWVWFRQIALWNLSKSDWNFCWTNLLIQWWRGRFS